MHSLRDRALRPTRRRPPGLAHALHIAEAMLRALLVVALLGCSSTVASAGAASDIAVHDSPADAQITEGETVITTDPDTAYRVVTDYPRWRTIFPDIAEVVITQQQGVDARVTFIKPDGNRDNIHFHNQPAARMVWFEDTGGRATVWAEIVFVPGNAPGTTRVHSRLFADVHGIASLVVSDRRLREMREQRVRSDLAHLRAFFAPSVASGR